MTEAAFRGAAAPARTLPAARIVTQRALTLVAGLVGLPHQAARGPELEQGAARCELRVCWLASGRLSQRPDGIGDASGQPPDNADVTSEAGLEVSALAKFGGGDPPVLVTTALTEVPPTSRRTKSGSSRTVRRFPLPFQALVSTWGAVPRTTQPHLGFTQRGREPAARTLGNLSPRR